MFPATGVPSDLAGALECAVNLLQAMLPPQAADQIICDPPVARGFLYLPTVQRLDIAVVDNTDAQTGARLDGWHFELRCWPADILSQARTFWPQLTIPRLAALPQSRKGPGGSWDVVASPHLSFAQTHLVFREDMEMDNLALEDYCIFWKTHLRAMRQYGRHEGATDFATLLAVLAQIHPLSPAGLQHFAFHFTHGRRQTATLNPGLYMGFELPTDEALALDQKALLVTHVRTKIRAAFALWGEDWAV